MERERSVSKNKLKWTKVKEVGLSLGGVCCWMTVALLQRRRCGLGQGLEHQIASVPRQVAVASHRKPLILVFIDWPVFCEKTTPISVSEGSIVCL